MSSNCKTNLIPEDEWLERAYSCEDNAMSWLSGAADALAQISSAEAPLTDAPVMVEPRRITKMENDKKYGSRNAYKHVPHKDRPPLIVARRNARERRRVQAVNTAFMRLRKVVPIVNHRGKRVSKVKTLQTAIDYISGLQALLKETTIYYDLDIISEYQYSSPEFCSGFEDFEDDF